MKFFFKKKQSTRGFSLIEILVVITSLILVSGFGFATLYNTQRRQAVDQSAYDIKQFIEQAKYNTISRVKPDNSVFPLDCTQKVVSGYEIVISSTQVIMNVQCKNTIGALSSGLYTSKNFPSQFTITTNGCLKFSFDVLTGSLQCTNPGQNLPTQIGISRGATGYNKTIIIDASGNVSLQ